MPRITEEASTLGLPPGSWPPVVELNGKIYWRKVVNQDHEGDVTTVLYKSDDGAELEIFND